MTTETKTAHTPETIMTVFCEAMNRGDLDSLLALYEDTACLIPQLREQPAHGKAAIRQALHSYLALQPKISFQTKARVQAGDVALLRTAWRLTGTGPDGSPLQMAHESTDVARRQPDGGWKFVIDHPFGADPL
ncbi:MAG TPA: nuclear transport factor 2 family protein [Nitrospiraceae bacterium]|nr:nuclear transport factor 2 family protein [Nitrospiraceae bacterium]